MTYLFPYHYPFIIPNVIILNLFTVSNIYLDIRTGPPNVTEDGRRLMLVAAKSRVKPVAGSIARTTRDEGGEPPVLSAVGAASVNQAIKAIAIARDFLQGDDIDLSIEVSRRPQQDVKDVIIFALNKHPKGTLLEDVDADKENESDLYQDMRSASNSTPPALGGAIAKNIRDGKRPRITAIGQRPVFKAVCAVVLARKYLKKEQMDLDLVPRFTLVKFENGTDANAVQLIVLPRKLV